MFHSCSIRRLAVPSVILAIGLLGLSAPGAGAARTVLSKARPYTIAGTAVTADGHTGMPNVHVTLMPDSTTGLTDKDGDFLFPWDGKNAWVVVVPDERAADGSEWCRRVAIRARTGETENAIRDLGTVRVTPRAVLGYVKVPIPPSGFQRPASIHVAGPKAGAPDTCRTQISFATDLWGKVTRVEVCGGDPPPAGLKAAMLDWIRSVPWNVATDTSCGPGEPFKTLEWMDYAWADTAWVRVQPLKNEQRPGSSVPSSPQR